MSAAFLRELAEVIDEDCDARRMDGNDVDQLKAAADQLESLEQLQVSFGDRDKEQQQLAADKERLIYHVLNLLAAPPDEDRLPRDMARSCLEQFGYAPDSNRAIQMLSLGEPQPSRRHHLDGTPCRLNEDQADADHARCYLAAASDVQLATLIRLLRERLALYEQALGDACRIAIGIRSTPGTWSEHDCRVAAGRLLDKSRELIAMPNLHRNPPAGPEST